MKLTQLLCYGRINAIPRLTLAAQTGLDERILRKKINALRLAGYPIISGQDGYWLSCDPYEIEAFARSMLHRAREVARVSEASFCTADRFRGQIRIEGW